MRRVGALLSSTVAAGAVTMALASAPAGAKPLHITLPGQFATPPTISQCLKATGFACYSPLQLEQAYDMSPLFAKGLDGSGETIVIVDSFGSPTIQSDLATFDQAYGLPAPPSFKIITPVGTPPHWNPANGTMTGWGVETSLDVEYSHAMAPGANILLVETPVAETEGVTGFPQIVGAENYVINHNLGDVISQSFGATEQTFPSAQSLLALRGAYQNAKSHNITVLASSGDTGVTNYTLNGLGYYPYKVVGWPSSDPLVTSVGGTQLLLDQAGDRTAPDSVWNETSVFGSPVAGSGGLSSIFGRPNYQNGVASIVGDWRGTPDVSLSASVYGGALVYMSFPGSGGAGYYIIGGTSEASPLFAGIVADADQAAGHPLGQLNPALYAIQQQDENGITDIHLGNNTVTFGTTTVQGYDAVPGYDMASGLGTPDGMRLVEDLTHYPGL